MPRGGKRPGAGRRKRVPETDMRANQQSPRGRGAPTAYRPDFADQARKLCVLGATDMDLGDFFGVDRTTIWRWSAAHEEFCNALKAGKASADNRIEMSLYHRAAGYTYDAVKIMQDKGAPVIVPYREHVPPDTTAAIFWLKNRRKDEWRDKQEISHSGTVNVTTKEYVLPGD